MQALAERAPALIASFSAALLGATLAATVDQWHWTVALAAHFRVQYLALALLLGLVWPWVRPRRAWVALALTATAMLNAVAVAPLFAAQAPTSGGPVLRVLSFNTWPDNPNTDEIWAYVERLQPDIAVLFETSEAMLQAPSIPLAKRYRRATVGEFIVLLDRDLEASVDSATHIHRATVVDVHHAGRRLHVIAAHAYPALGNSLDDDAERTFGQLEDHCRQASAPIAIVGDLNTTPWGWRFRRLLERGGLIDTEPGRGLQPSFPAWPPLLGVPFGIPIDHCVHSAELRCASRQLGPALGSNHRPLIVELAWAGD